MDWSPLDVVGRRLTIYGTSENIEHSSKYFRSDWCLELPTGVLDLLASGQALGRSQCDAANAMGTEQHQHLDRNLPVRSSSQK